MFKEDFKEWMKDPAFAGQYKRERLKILISELATWLISFSDHSRYCDKEKDPMWDCNCGFDNLIWRAQNVDRYIVENLDENVDNSA